MKWVKPKTYTNPIFSYKKSTDQQSGEVVHHQVVIIGGGPTGLMAALDLASRGIKSVVITRENTVVVGSRAICFAKKTLEVANRLKVADRMLDKGIVWNVGKVYNQESLVYEFNLLPEEGHKIPAFINLQQYYFEEYLVDKLKNNPLVDIRWEEELVDLTQEKDKVRVELKTPEGNYKISGSYLLACDGVRSPVRELLNIPYEGELFEENFLIADITMENDFPTERWFWFDPPFNKGYSALLHKQPDGVWRIDLQLGREIDKAEELEPEKIKSRLRQMLGEDVKFELEWTSIYQFRCMRMEKFVHDRIIFAGDSAHLVSPFGARGANGGVQDVDNLCWKLACVLHGQAGPELLDTYDEERGPATDENIFHSTNATDFISPKSEISLQFRNAALELAKTNDFARSIINSGRLSHPYRYVDSSIVQADDSSGWATDLQVGYTVKDGVYREGYLTDALGNDFTLLMYGEVAVEHSLLTKIVRVNKNDADIVAKYDLKPGSWYLVRPDHYIAARGRTLDAAAIIDALRHSLLKASVNPAISASPKDAFSKYSNDTKYKLLIDAHKGLSKEESEFLNSQIILLMMDAMGTDQLNHILQATKTS